MLLVRTASSSQFNSMTIMDGRYVGIAWKHENTSAAILAESEEDGVDDQVDIESWSDGGDCMWLFPDTKSPPLNFTDHLLIERFSSWLSMSRSLSFLSKSANSFFDGSRINPIKEASLLLERKANYIACQEDLDHEVTTWLLEPKWNGLEEISLGSSKEQSSYEDSSYCNSSWVSLSTEEDSSSWIWDVDNTGVCDILLDYEVTGWDIFQSELPSPLHMNRFNSLTESSDSCVSSVAENSLCCDLLSEALLETANIHDFDNDGPLFWPSESQFNWNSDVLFDCFCISPRRVGSGIGKSEKLCSTKSIILKLHSRKLKDRKEEFFSTRSKVPPNLDLQKKLVNKNMKRFSARPSKLSITSQDSTQKRPLGIKCTSLEEQTKIIPTNVLITDCRDLLEECFLSGRDVPIESLVGLKEFDGHEGVDEDFKEDSFFLDEPFDEKLRASREMEHMSKGGEEEE
ncbi:hypothetical protein FRX31_008251 [Thalictrum thalictroides]|uniref:Uncharacterized protein n=1 Tax=Thalictrum thalictroides TaxID=46969 RepID=A0A7J6X0A5_THATH|nr:hypothetical protein FRX31_008251 [Thalictrum thalictroides]